MKIIPAVDIKGGRCVRLVQGKADRETVYSDDPVAMAERWDEEGASLIHVVDLDGAFDGEPANAESIKNIVYHSSADIQVGGGIRTLAAIESYLKAGVYQVILGTIAQKDPAFVEQACKEFPGRITVGIDAKNGMVAVKGWVEVSERSAADLATELKAKGVDRFIFTDISRDGMLEGPNLESIRAFAGAVKAPVIASGGVGSLKDIEDLLKLEGEGVIGVIVGKALYDNTLTYQDANRLANQEQG
ncbi:MAG: 1-(5-phosphoribosyl)-5-[(5-phosphoribosylamino)methylideneamino]imidazole-4-carboxamide isomerase [Candidatus Nitrohelix vancouverensis]|uniref:1-(5-phosphoribosyl)-5-[(5-phosphoribosylamino)methylideneamino] imidazole-4-carboxamide isomerase n=1 Tax=Candidatus Nitrohelix vancouverensis TaxID=2705534 RepID=A0A7T0G3B8_9BACT|nr:MAG: 1-(5-phosphoribosyl)-5-[(5-phosphoribosylamino)methylideneamino]imidazole-4-carboxamide isomerase [Candidatus Nitrohelix vancouverensis]